MARDLDSLNSSLVKKRTNFLLECLAFAVSKARMTARFFASWTVGRVTLIS